MRDMGSNTFGTYDEFVEALQTRIREWEKMGIATLQLKRILPRRLGSDVFLLQISGGLFKQLVAKETFDVVSN